MGGAVGIVVSIAIHVPVAVVRTVMAIAVVINARRFVFDIITGIRIVRIFRDRRRRRPLQNHFRIKLVIVEHAPAFGIVLPVRMIVHQFRTLRGPMIQSEWFGTVALAIRRQ